MFISKSEKDRIYRINSLLQTEATELMRDVETLKCSNQDLRNRVDTLENLITAILQINSDEIGTKVNELVKCIYSGFKGLFVDDEKKSNKNKKTNNKSLTNKK